MIFEFLAMASIAVASGAVASLLGLKSKTLGIGAGLIFVSATRAVTFTALYALGLQQYSVLLFWAACAALVVIAGVKNRAELWQLSQLPVIIAVVSVVLTRVLNFENYLHGDSKWILIASHVIQDSQSLSQLEGPGPFKRGFLVPQLLALGPTDEYLSALPPYIFAAMACAGIYLLTLVLKKYSLKTRVLAIAPVLLVVATTVMAWRSIFYINGHTMMGLLIALIVAVSIHSARANSVSKTDFYILLTASFLIAIVRPEGIAVGVVAMLPVLTKNWLSRSQLYLILAAPVFSLLVWLYEYESYVLDSVPVPWLILLAAGLGATALVVLPVFDFIRVRLSLISAILLPAILLAEEIIFAAGMAKGNYGLVKNLFYGYGQWGYLAPFIILVLVVAGYKNKPQEYWLLARTSFTLVFTFMVAKTLDGGQAGKPDLGRAAWADSLNRMWIHLLVVGLVTVIYAVASRLEPEAKPTKKAKRVKA